MQFRMFRTNAYFRLTCYIFALHFLLHSASHIHFSCFTRLHFKFLVSNSQSRALCFVFAFDVPRTHRIALRYGKLYRRPFRFSHLEHKISMPCNLIFCAGPNTQAMTATVLAIFVERGRLSWDAPVASFFPGLSVHHDFKYTPPPSYIHTQKRKKEKKKKRKKEKKKKRKKEKKNFISALHGFIVSNMGRNTRLTSLPAVTANRVAFERFSQYWNYMAPAMCRSKAGTKPLRELGERTEGEKKERKEPGQAASLQRC
jgi:hypothetical protein